MQRTHTLRNRLLAAAAVALLLAAAPAPAHAASKEIIELQTQVQQLLDKVQRIQSTLDSRFGVMQNLAQQTADNANQMTAAVTALQQKLAAQSDALSGKLDTASGQVQSLNDSVDELKSRIAKLDKSIQDLQTQLQNIQNPPSHGGERPGSAAVRQPALRQAGPGRSAPAAVARRRRCKETFQAGVRDYNAARYDVAAGEFQDVIHYYPLDELAGTAQFYLGEIAYQQMKLRRSGEGLQRRAGRVSRQRQGSGRATAQGDGAAADERKEAGMHELRLLIQRHPQTPEAAQARTKLNGMGDEAPTAEKAIKR